LDLKKLKEMATGDLLVDARNLYDTGRAQEHGWRHLSVGR